MLIMGQAQKYVSRATMRAYASVMRVPWTGPGTVDCFGCCGAVARVDLVAMLLAPAACLGTRGSAVPLPRLHAPPSAPRVPLVSGGPASGGGRFASVLP